MTMPTMRAKDGVIRAQMSTDADGNRLFADIGVTSAVHKSLVVRVGRAWSGYLEAAPPR